MSEATARLELNVDRLRDRPTGEQGVISIESFSYKNGNRAGSKDPGPQPQKIQPSWDCTS